ncbi:hypothetical protein [Spirosoma fluviale]|uniref:Uncharacterized protein n=1 Tax=Spirosoma fluviale TaxID=1597977 RepID=A0A286GW32_9BACT|nr:hypothetical protein [Spirosoma fluviale]SOD99730.1 hypothetical protein SAMN06269250_0133 [Spirosoma fluviale]
MVYYLIFWLASLQLKERPSPLPIPLLVGKHMERPGLFVQTDTLPQPVLPFRSDTTSRLSAQPDTVSGGIAPVRESLPGDSLPIPNEPFITVDRREAEPFMGQSIAFVRDFINRLNYRRTPMNQIVDSSSRQMYPRVRYIRSLFDEQDPRTSPRSGKFNRIYEQLVNEFVDEVASDTAQVYIPEIARNLFGDVTYSVRYKGVLKSIRFYLVMTRTEKYYEWKIIDVEAPFLKPASTDTVQQYVAQRDTLLFIASQTHETQFLALYNHLHARRNLMAFAIDNPPARGRLVALSKAIENGSLSVETTQSVSLYLNTGRGWVLRLNDLNREKENSGWLITELYGHNSLSLLPPLLTQYIDLRPANSPK